MKICIVRLGAIGDIIYALAPLQFLKAKIKDIQIDWLVESSLKKLILNVKEIDNILTIDLKSIKKNKISIFSQIKLLKKYSKNNYDLIIDAQGLIKSAICSYFLKSKKGRVIGFDRDSIREKIATFFYDIKINSDYNKNVLFRNKDIICRYFKCDISDDEFISKKPIFYLKDYKIDITFDIIFIVGASKINKIYPKERFLALSRLLKNYKILTIWGDRKEKDIANFLHNNNKNIIISPKLDLDEVKYIINKAKIVIGNDTGLTHLAWGLNKKTITIYGNTPYFRNSFITNNNLVVYSNSKVNPKKLDHDDFSIKNIDEKEIYEQIKFLMIDGEFRVKY